MTVLISFRNETFGVEGNRAREFDMASFKLWAMSFAVASVLALPQAVRAEDDLGYQAIRNHDWATAEQQLQAGLQQEPGNASRQLNLAFVYAQTGRKAEAAALYREILKRDGDRFASSPRAGKSVALLAERGLAQLKNN
jgi:thioredoxin-like negative regulator of GroEL